MYIDETTTSTVTATTMLRRGGSGGYVIATAIPRGEGEEEEESEEEVNVRNFTAPNVDIDNMVDMLKQGEIKLPADVVERHSRQGYAEGIVTSSRSCSP